MTTQLDLTPEILAEIHYQRYNHPSPLVQRRMEAVWPKGHDLLHGKIAELVGVTENTIRDYFELYQQGGIEKLKELNYAGSKSGLDEHIHFAGNLLSRTSTSQYQRSAKQNRNHQRCEAQRDAGCRISQKNCIFLAAK
jgi:predicted transcriptional regulator